MPAKAPRESDEAPVPPIASEESVLQEGKVILEMAQAGLKAATKNLEDASNRVVEEALALVGRKRQSSETNSVAGDVVAVGPDPDPCAGSSVSCEGAFARAALKKAKEDHMPFIEYKVQVVGCNHREKELKESKNEQLCFPQFASEHVVLKANPDYMVHLQEQAG